MDIPDDYNYQMIIHDDYNNPINTLDDTLDDYNNKIISLMITIFQ